MSWSFVAVAAGAARLSCGLTVRQSRLSTPASHATTSGLRRSFCVLPSFTERDAEPRRARQDHRGRGVGSSGCSGRIPSSSSPWRRSGSVCRSSSWSLFRRPAAGLTVRRGPSIHTGRALTPIVFCLALVLAFFPSPERCITGRRQLRLPAHRTDSRERRQPVVRGHCSLPAAHGQVPSAQGVAQCRRRASRGLVTES